MRPAPSPLFFGDRITVKQSKAATQSPTPETFRFLVYEWNVTQANEMLDAGLLGDVEQMDVEGPYAMLAGGFVGMAGQRAQEIDLSRPCIGIRFPHDKGGILIDGWHRINEAHERGIASLPIVVIRGGLERAIRVAGCPWHLLDETDAERDKRRAEARR